MSRQSYERILHRLHVPVKRRDRQHLQSVINLCEKFSDCRKDQWSFDKRRNKQRRLLNMTKRAIYNRGISMGLITCSESTFRRCIQ